MSNMHVGSHCLRSTHEATCANPYMRVDASFARPQINALNHTSSSIPSQVTSPKTDPPNPQTPLRVLRWGAWILHMYEQISLKWLVCMTCPKRTAFLNMRGNILFMHLAEHLPYNCLTRITNRMKNQALGPCT